MPKGISRHDEIFKFIVTFHLNNFRMPTRKEIIYECKILRGPLQRVLNRLEQKGKLRRIPKEIIEFRIMK